MTEREGLNLLVVDDDPDMRALVRAHLKKELPRATIDEVDPASEPMPDLSGDDCAYDCVLLDYDWGPGGSGLEWLRRHGKSASSPAIILLTGADDVYIAARAMKLGAEDYLNKKDLTARRLAELITSATESRSASRPETVVPGSLNETHPTLPPTSMAAPIVEGYEIGALIGKGATAQVYLAERLQDGLTVVLKFLKVHMLEASQDRLARFTREAELVSQLHSPQVVRIYEQRFTDELAFIAMEYLPGGDLRDRIAEGVSADQALTYMNDLLLGLKAIHAVGVVHRDLKPGNIMFRRDGSLAIADFGLSRRMDTSTDLTMSGQIMGTPAYMSPEQGQGEVATPSSDLYSAGVIFYEMLTGKKPYEAASLTGVIYKHITAPIPTLPPEAARFQPFIDQVMAKEPDDRPADIDAVMDLLAGL